MTTVNKSQQKYIKEIDCSPLLIILVHNGGYANIKKLPSCNSLLNLDIGINCKS